MTLDENIATFEPFVKNLLDSFDKINIYLEPHRINERVKQKESWTNSINSEKERVKSELTEKEYDFYERSIQQIEKEYESRFLSM